MKARLLSTAILGFALAGCVGADSTGALRASPDNAQNGTLEAYHWSMDHAVTAKRDVDPQWVYRHPDGTAGTLTFASGRLAVSGLCNTLGASYVVDGSKIEIGQVVSTMKMCPDPGLMQYERAFGERLAQAAMWHVTRMPDEPAGRPRLTLHFDDGAQWVLTGQPTAETRYGGKGETLFLEVAAHRVPCSHPLMPETDCLQVRTVEYDTVGLKRGHGDWQNFYGTIDGYEHTPGMRQILRVKRYTVQNPPADASRYAYVLDMVVESDIRPD